MSESNQNSTKQCPACKSNVSTDAIKCSQCGSDLRGWAERNKVMLIIGAVIGFLILVGKTPSHNTSNPQEVAIKISAGELFASYKQNEIDADNKFKGNLIEVTGLVGDIGKDIADSPYVALITGDRFFRVQCMLADKSAGANLRKGMLITLRGIGDRKIGNVILRDCVPLENAVTEASPQVNDVTAKPSAPGEVEAAPASDEPQAPYDAPPL